MDQWITCFIDSADHPVRPGKGTTTRRNGKSDENTAKNKPEPGPPKEHVKTRYDNEVKASGYS